MVASLDAYSNVKLEIGTAVFDACKKAEIGVTKEEVDSSIEEAKPGFGDFACTLPFSLAKKEKKSPKEVAEKIVEKLKKPEAISEIKIVGPYMNFYLGAGFVSKAVSEIGRSKERYGSGTDKNLKVMVEFPSVNPNKPWHVGHLRNALLGDSVARSLEFAGYRVERIDYIDDLGMQVATSLWSYMNVNEKIEGKADQWIGTQYVEASKRAEDKKVEGEVREIVKELEAGGGEIAEKGRVLCSKCVKAQYETAYALGIYHDALVWESDIVRGRILEHALEKMLASGKVVKEESGENRGCIVAKLAHEEEFKNLQNPDKVLVRSDGTATYTAKDIAFHMWKFGMVESPFKYEKFEKQPNGEELYTTSGNGEPMDFGKADIVVNLIGVEQKYPQKVLNSILRSMGYEKQAENHIHLSYEHAGLPEGKFSGREGTWLGYSADDVIEEAEKRAYEEIRGRFKDMGEEEKRTVARMVGLGAVRFSFIRTTPEKKLIFKWEEALNFEGDSAPYVQYSHARCSRILEKAGEIGRAEYNLLVEKEELELAKLLAKFPGIAEKSAQEYRPHCIAEFSLEVATQFSRFYNACPVLKADGELRDARLGLVNATRIVLKNSLALIGIEAPERM
ncbi:MAG: arginine--tRNA ligase [Candidatus Micrarchaeota archaeon]